MNKHPAAEFLAPRYWLYWLGVLSLRLLSLLPLRALWLVSAVVGEIVFWLHARGRRVALKNTALCFPELLPETRRRLVRRHFRALAQALLSLPIAWWGSKRRLKRLVRIRDRHHYDQMLGAGRRVILLAPHFVGLDFGGIRLSQERPVVSMYRGPRGRFGDYLLRRRARFGAALIERSAALRSLIRFIREGRPFYYLPDQDPGAGAFVFAPFFGVPAATVKALSRIAELTEAVVIPCFTRQLPYGRGYEVVFHAPLTPFPSNDPVQDARCMNAAIEKGVMEMPEQYMWTYKRFKTQPGKEPSPYA